MGESHEHLPHGGCHHPSLLHVSLVDMVIDGFLDQLALVVFGVMCRILEPNRDMSKDLGYSHRLLFSVKFYGGEGVWWATIRLSLIDTARHGVDMALQTYIKCV